MSKSGIVEKEIIFTSLKAIANVVVETFGRNCEVAIHDFSKLPHSLIHIIGELTNRKPGAPITDLVLRAMRTEGDNVADICNYKTITKDGKPLKSSTAFIRNSKNRVIGAFCINFCITEYLNAISMIENLVQAVPSNGKECLETFASSLSEIIDSLIEAEIKRAGKQPCTMTKEEKVNFIVGLETQGAFLLKGAVDVVATTLGVSKYTVYNYLKEVRRNSNGNQVVI